MTIPNNAVADLLVFAMNMKKEADDVKLFLDKYNKIIPVKNMADCKSFIFVPSDEPKRFEYEYDWDPETEEIPFGDPINKPEVR